MTCKQRLCQLCVFMLEFALAFWWHVDGHIYCFERGDLLGFQAASEVLCRIDFRYFFNQMFL